MKTPTVAAIALTAAALSAAATGWYTTSVSARSSVGVVPTNMGYRGPASVPLGDVAGVAIPVGAIDMPNPLGNSASVIAEGKKLFIGMNCAGCHGYGGGGGMGPPLKDSYWRYGGAPVQIYRTLYEGRPQGMPAWGIALPPDQLWKLTAYVSSLGGGVKPANAVAAERGDVQGSTDLAPSKNAAEGGNALEGQ